MTTYLFYDIETTGLNKAFDQVVQFCAIRTDAGFKEIERKNFTVRPRPDVIMSPGALTTHRISISEMEKGLPEYEATAQIHRWLNMPGTVSLGYNTMGFDDEFLRFSFHRNLLSPYTHQYSNGCHRMDILPFAVIYHLYKKEAMAWPEIDGKPTLKLEHLCAANKLSSGRAHDAETDVLATLALAKIFNRHEKMWRYISGYFHKTTDADRISRFPVVHQTAGCDHTTGLLIGTEFGAALQYQAPVLYIGDSIPYSNQTLWLRLDLPKLRETSKDNIPETTWVHRKRLGDTPIILPPLKRYMKFIDEERTHQMRENLRWIAANKNSFLEIVQYHKQFKYPEIPNLDPDAALYQLGFLSRSETQTCGQFHALPPRDKARVIKKFPREEIRQIAARILFRNYPEQAPEAYKKDFNRYMNQVNARGAEAALRDYKGALRTTPAAALSEIDRLAHEGDLDAEQKKLLEELKEYLKNRFP